MAQETNRFKPGFLIDISVLGNPSFLGPGYLFGSSGFSSFLSVNDNISLGGGVGFAVFAEPQITGHSDKLYGYPLYAYGRWDFKTRKKIVPFIALRAGYLITNTEYQSSYIETTVRSYSGGLYSSLSGGAIYYFKNRMGISLALATNFANIGYKDIADGNAMKDRFNHLNYSIDLGFTF